MTDFFKRLFQKIGGEKGHSFSPFEKKIGYRFRNPDILKHALSHRSYAFTRSGNKLDSNERFEFLGDAFLGYIVSDFLYHRYPEKTEGNLSRIKSMLISRKALKAAADAIDLGHYLLLSRSEEKTGGRDRFSINTNAFEAVVAAIYLDGGIKPARSFIQNNVLNMLSSLLKDKEYVNYKSRLLEKVQAQGHGVPKYTVLKENGPDHNKTFNVSVSISGRRAGAGTGKSKKDAEQLAARAAIENLKQEKSSIDLSDCE